MLDNMEKYIKSLIFSTWSPVDWQHIIIKKQKQKKERMEICLKLIFRQHILHISVQKG